MKSQPKQKLANRKSGHDKLHAEHPSHGQIVAIPASIRKPGGAGTLLIPRPLDVDKAMRSVRKGRLITMTTIRQRLARAAGADAACPLTTGIFARIAAEAAEEAAKAGLRRITPYWRTLKDGGKLNDKFPGGPAAQAVKLRTEGFSIEKDRHGRPARVKAFEQYAIAK